MNHSLTDEIQAINELLPQLAACRAQMRPDVPESQFRYYNTALCTLAAAESLIPRLLAERQALLAERQGHALLCAELLRQEKNGIVRWTRPLRQRVSDVVARFQ